MIKLSFIKDSLLYTIGNALPMAASIILLPFYANYLNASLYAALSFYIGISLLFQIFFSFSFEQYYGVIYTEIKQNAEKVRTLNGSIFIYLIVQGILIILLSLFFGESVLKNIFDENIPVVFYPYGLLSILTGFFNALFKVSMSTYIYTQQSKIFFYSNLINFTATVLISITGLFLHPDTLVGPIYGRFLSGIIIFILNIGILWNNITWKYERTYIKEFIQKSWALFAYTILIWITGNIDRYFLKNYIPVNDLASYDLIMKCFIGIEFIQNGLSMAIISKVFDLWKKENKITFTHSANRYFNVFILSIVFFIVLFVFLLPFFIRLIIKDHQYYSGFYLIGVIAVAYILRTLQYPYYFAYLFSKKTTGFFVMNAIAIIIQVVLSYFLIPLYGLLAAVFIVIFTRLISVVLFHFSIYSKTEFKINYFKWYVIPAMVTIYYCAVFFILQEHLIIVHFFVIPVLLIISVLIYRGELMPVLADIKNKIFAQS